MFRISEDMLTLGAALPQILATRLGGVILWGGNTKSGAQNLVTTSILIAKIT